MCSTPLVVTHPSALVRDALRCILTKSQFRPVRILPTLDGGAENYLGSAGICIWLLGVRECASTTNDLVRRVVAANPSVRPVILAESHPAKDIVFALASGAFGFLSQNIPSKQLIKSLELVVLGQTVIHPQLHQMAFAQMGVQGNRRAASALRRAIPCCPRGLARGREARNFEWGPGWRRRQRPVAPRVSDSANADRGRIK
jgi:DNA-binding NarL/FixJ family response regulator